MIHLARPTVSPVANIVFAWNLFCFEKWGRTNGRHVQKQWSLRDRWPASWINWRWEQAINYWQLLKLFLSRWVTKNIVSDKIEISFLRSILSSWAFVLYHHKCYTKQNKFVTLLFRLCDWPSGSWVTPSCFFYFRSFAAKSIDKRWQSENAILDCQAKGFIIAQTARSKWSTQPHPKKLKFVLLEINIISTHDLKYNTQLWENI